MNIKKMLKNKTGQALASMNALVIGLVTVVITLVIGLSIADQVQNTQTVGSAAFNATDQGIAGLTTFADFLPLIALVAVGGIVLFFVARFLGGGRQ